MIFITKGKSFKNSGILSRGLSEGVHPYGVLKRYHDYVIFDYEVIVIFEYRISYAFKWKGQQWLVDL